MHDMGSVEAAPIQNYVVAHYVDDYLTGLGAYGALHGGAAVTQDIETASNLIETLAMPFVKAAHDNGADNATILATAESQLSSYENLYVGGLSDVGNVAAGVLGDDAPSGSARSAAASPF
jgi:hypothetical protein